MDDPWYKPKAKGGLGGGGDALTYSIPLAGSEGQPASVRVTLYYQAIPPFYLQDRFCTTPSRPDTAASSSWPAIPTWTAPGPRGGSSRWSQRDGGGAGRGGGGEAGRAGAVRTAVRRGARQVRSLRSDSICRACPSTWI